MLVVSVAGADLLAAHQAGLSVIVKEAMANGRLTARNAHPAFASRLALLQQTAQQVCVAAAGAAAALALRQVLAVVFSDLDQYMTV
jgi:dTDP-4-amino-4,6-dideoxygalactose transaminase